jgi:hypothetical protein
MAQQKAAKAFHNKNKSNEVKREIAETKYKQSSFA